MNMTKHLTMCYTSLSVHYYHSVHKALGSWRKCSFDITCSLHQCYCNCKLLSMATQHPELERLSMGARPKLGQMRTKHMSPWQPSKNKIERVREAGGTRISTTKLSIHTDVLYICMRFVVRPNGQMERIQIVLFMLLCFSTKLLGLHALLCDMYGFNPCILFHYNLFQFNWSSSPWNWKEGRRFRSTLRHLHPSSFFSVKLWFSCDCTVINCWIILP